MNIFKKALIVALSIGLISVPTVTKEVEAADTTRIYLDTEYCKSWWSDGGARIFASSNSVAEVELKSFVSWERSFYYFDVVSSDKKITVKRYSPDKKQTWNSFTIQNATYSSKNMFKIWDNGGGSNWEYTTVYHLTYVDDGVETDTAAISGWGVATTIATPAAKEGYEFGGWYSTPTFDEGTLVTGDYSKVFKPFVDNKVYAKWIELEQPVSVKYYSEKDDTETYYVESLSVGDKASGPSTAPTKRGFDFDGWYTESGVKYDFNTVLEGDLNLYANWKYNPIVETITDKIYFENNASWENIYLYSWDDAGNNNASWPGVKMNLLHDNIYWIDANPNHGTIIFNTGDGTKTADITRNGNNYYNVTSKDKVTGSVMNEFDSSIYFQNQKANDTTSNIRLVGSLGNGDNTFDLSAYNEVGFIVSSKVKNENKTTMKSVKSVYTSVDANGETVNASELTNPADYVYLITISGVPVTQELTVTSYAKDSSDRIVYGETKVIYVYNA